MSSSSGLALEAAVLDSGTAAHPVDEVAAIDAMPITERLKLLEWNVIGQIPQRIVCRLRVTKETQGVDQPLPAVTHPHHQACRWRDALV
jgi:hypothetical protein